MNGQEATKRATVERVSETGAQPSVEHVDCGESAMGKIASKVGHEEEGTSRDVGRQERSHSEIQDREAQRARLASQIYFVLMTFGLWLGVGLPPVWGGVLNAALLLIGAVSMFKVLTGVRIL